MKPASYQPAATRPIGAFVFLIRLCDILTSFREGSCMFRSSFAVALLAIAVPVLSWGAENTTVQSYFTGKQMAVKIDMPGTQKGVDLRFNKPAPMDWKEYQSRIKQFGPAIRKGDTARVTSVVVKKDMIEFQLDGGGFGTFGDDTSTAVAPKVVDKSDYEKQLEQQISDTDDPDKKKQLQRELDKEKARRERQNAINQSNAEVASQIKSAKVADQRAHGGSRFNLRWAGSIPADQLTPEAVMKLLADYVDFSGLQTGGAVPAAQNAASVPSQPAAAGEPSGSPTAQLKRGMKQEEVNTLLGQGRQLSESTSADGLKTQTYEYLPGDRRVEITYVDGLVLRFSISSR
jgi:hypothetical protein